MPQCVLSLSSARYSTDHATEILLLIAVVILARA